MARNFFDELSDTISKTAQGFSTKVGGIYEAQKVTSKISGEERMIKKLMEDMGKILYERFKAGEETDEELSEICGKIGEHLEKIEELKGEALKKKGQKVCPACGKVLESNFPFCPFCGASVPVPEPEPEPEEEEIPIEGEEEKKDEEACEGAEDACEEFENAAKEAADFMADAAEKIADAAKDFFES